MEVSANINSLSDLELISRFKQTGNNNLVGVLYERYTHLVFGVCMKYLENAEDSKDATVEIFVKLLEDLKKHEVSNFKGWLYQVAKNHCLMKFRKDKKRIEYHPELQEDLAAVMEWDNNLHLHNDSAKERQLMSMEAAIAKLPEEQRTCIELFYLQEQSYQQVMLKTGFDFRQVKSYIQNGKRNLKNLISSRHEKESG